MLKLTRNLLVLSVSFLLFQCQNTGDAAGQADAGEVALDTTLYLKLGDELTAKTFDTLSTALRQKIAEAGPAEAIGYCNVQAYPITALQAETGIDIRRTSLKYRNPKNRPDSLESAQLTALQKSIDQGQSPRTQVIRLPDGSVHYFKPIMVQPLCLNCHGEPQKDIQPKTLAAIEADYPEDRAIGYAAGDLRGAWHITFTVVEE